MKMNKRKARVLTTAIEIWMKRHIITRDTGDLLLSSYEVAGFDWKQVARYSFWISIVCIIISLGAIIADERLMNLLAKLFRAPAAAKCLIAAVVAALLYYYGVSRKKKKPEKIFSNEAVFFLGVLSTAVSVAFFGRAIDTGSGHFSILFLIAAVIYGVLGLWFPSKLVWIFSLLSIGGWMGTETGYVSGWGAYYLGMNYPLRFVVFGIALTALSFALLKWRLRHEFFRPTLAMGLLYLFIALWIMSIFGNYGNIRDWQEVNQIHLIHWSLLFGLAAVAAVYHGIKEDDAMTRGFGITFLFINLYTRFFEYFWDGLHKAIFFALLAASFWYLGTRAEKIWNPAGISKKPACEK